MTSSTKNKAKWNALRMTSFYSFEPLNEIKDKTIEFEQSVSPDFDKIEQHAFSYLDEFFLKRLTKEENNLFKVVRDIEITNGLISMDILAKQNNTTRRQLHLYIFLMKQKHSDNFDLLRYLTSQKNDGRMAPYYLASKACLEDLKITHPFKNYFYTIGLYYGEGTCIRIGTADYNLTRGSLLTIGPGMTCQWLNTTFPSNDTLFFYDDIFVNNFSRSFFYSLEFFCPDEKSVIQLSDRQFEEMQQLFSTLRAIADKPEAVSGILYSILIISQKYFWKLHRGNKKELNGKEHTVVKFRELVSKNFSAYKEVAFYAEQLHISPKYLSEILVEYTGLSAKKWIEFHIMQEAKYLLSFWNMSVKEVSFQLGYTDTSHFSRAFRSYDGQLPTEFKNTIENPT